MALSRDVVIRLLGDANSAVQAQQEAAKAAEVSVGAYRRAEREFDRQQKAMATAARQQREAMADVGKGAATMGAVVAAGLAVSVKAAIDWESAWAGVRKTVDGSPAEMAALERELRNLATTLPATHEEIAGVAEAAGQLGIARGDIVEFTKVAVAMGVSTNLSAEEASTGMAQMMNIMGTASSDVDRLGSTLVALGNAGASTEAEILNMSQRIAGAANIIGATESDTLALSNTLASLGINAELGGGAMTRVLLKINTAMMEGGETAEGFARVAGMSAQEFAAKWRADPMAAVAAFTDGLGRVKDEGGNVVTTLGELGISGTQNLQVMLGLAGAQGQLTENLALGNKAWAENSALMNEANQRYETTASRIQVARNQLNDAAIDIGGTLMPVLAGAAEMVANFARGFEMLPGPAKEVVTVIGAVAAGVGLVGGAALIAIPKVVAFRETMDTLSRSTSATARGVSRFGMVMTGPWGLAIGAGVTLLGALVTALGASSRASEEAADYQRELASALQESGGAIDENIRAMAAQRAEETQVGKSSLLEWAERIGVELPVATDALLGQRDAVEEVSAAFEAYAQHALDAAIANGTADTFDPSGIYAARDAFIELSGSMGGAVAENQRVADAQKTTAEATAEATGATQGLLSGLNDVTGATAGAVGGIAEVGGAAEATEGQMDAATEAIAQWREELQKVASDFVDPLSAYKDLLSEKTEAEREAAEATAAATEDSSDSWEDYVDDVDVSLTDLADRLQEQLQAQADWRRNIVTISRRGGEEVASAIAAMGEEGVQLAAEMADGSDAEFKRMARLLLRDVEVGGDQWTAAMDTEMRVMAEVGRRGSKATADQIAKELGIGAREVADIAKRYGVNLASGVNPLLVALGKNRISGVNGRVGGLLEADGGLVDFYADGGMESHVAQIAPAGAWRVWAEPETGGEAYIPFASSKRGRSLDIWRETGRRLNAPEAQWFADGGFTSTSSVPRPPSTAPYRHPLSTAADATMAKAYGETVDWLEANLAPVLGPGIGYQAMMAALRTQFPGLSLNSGFRPGSITATGNLSYHAMGRAVDVPPQMDVFNWIAKNYPNSRELIFSPAGFRQVWNGQPHWYSEPTRGDHWDHVHWAMAKGGILNPHVRDSGGPLLPGYTFNGTGAPEWVLPRSGPGLPIAPRSASSVVNNSRTYNNTWQVSSGPTAREIAREIAEEQRTLELLRG